MSLETPRLRLLPCAPEHLLALIDQPERFGQVLGLPAADGLHGFYVSDDVSPPASTATQFCLIVSVYAFSGSAWMAMHTRATPGVYAIERSSRVLRAIL